MHDLGLKVPLRRGRTEMTLKSDCMESVYEIQKEFKHIS